MQCAPKVFTVSSSSHSTQCDTVPTGVGNVIGNKGAVGMLRRGVCEPAQILHSCMCCSVLFLFSIRSGFPGGLSFVPNNGADAAGFKHFYSVYQC